MQELIQKIREFAKARDWDQYHSPKNLAMALSVEVAELVEHFQWLSQAESRDLPPEKLAGVREEVADVLIYLLNLSDKLGIDPIAVAHEKMDKNGEKYPVHKARGNARKYTEM